MSNISLLGPSYDSSSGKIVGTTDYRIVDSLRYRNDGESMEEYEAYIDSITIIRIPLHKGNKDKQTQRAFELIHQYWTLGQTW